jgi:hypothetical protein
MKITAPSLTPSVTIDELLKHDAVLAIRLVVKVIKDIDRAPEWFLGVKTVV